MNGHARASINHATFVPILGIVHYQRLARQGAATLTNSVNFLYRPEEAKTGQEPTLRAFILSSSFYFKVLAQIPPLGQAENL